MDSKELAALPTAELASWLAERARDARSWVVAENFGALRELLVLIREAAKFSTGVNLQLLEVAEAFVVPLGGRHFGRRELVVQTFLKNGQRAEDFLLSALARPFAEPVPAELRLDIEKLLHEGVLLSGTQGLTVAPGMVGPLRELLSPPAFRMWAAVEQARAEAGAQRADQVALLLAAKVGVTTDEAARFLKKFPLTRKPKLRPNEVGLVPSPRNDQGPAVSEDAKWQFTEDASLGRAAAAQRN